VSSKRQRWRCMMEVRWKFAPCRCAAHRTGSSGSTACHAELAWPSLSGHRSDAERSDRARPPASVGVRDWGASGGNRTAAVGGSPCSEAKGTDARSKPGPRRRANAVPIGCRTAKDGGGYPRETMTRDRALSADGNKTRLLRAAPIKARVHRTRSVAPIRLSLARGGFPRGAPDRWRRRRSS
jgi:hypothetical protein